VAASEQGVDEMRADEAGPTGDHDVHLQVPPSDEI
jgi:hypothetical protein